MLNARIWLLRRGWLFPTKPHMAVTLGRDSVCLGSAGAAGPRMGPGTPMVPLSSPQGKELVTDFLIPLELPFPLLLYRNHALQIIPYYLPTDSLFGLNTFVHPFHFMWLFYLQFVETEALLELYVSFMTIFIFLHIPQNLHHFFGKMCILKRILTMFKTCFNDKNAQKKLFWEIKHEVVQVWLGWMWHLVLAHCHLLEASAFTSMLKQGSACPPPWGDVPTVKIQNRNIFRGYLLLLSKNLVQAPKFLHSVTSQKIAMRDPKPGEGERGWNPQWLVLGLNIKDLIALKYLWWFIHCSLKLRYFSI